MKTCCSYFFFLPFSPLFNWVSSQLHLAQLFYRNLDSALVQCKPGKTGWDYQPQNWTCIDVWSIAFWSQRARNLPPQIMLSAFTFECAEACNADVATQNADYLTLLPCLFFNDPSPLVFREADLSSCLISRLPQEQTLSQLQPWCLSVWLVVHWVNGPGSITGGHFSHERFISCFHRDRKKGWSVPLGHFLSTLLKIIHMPLRHILGPCVPTEWWLHNSVNIL